MLEPFHVLGIRERKVILEIDEEQALLDAELFQWESGGRLLSFPLGSFHAELGIWKHETELPAPSGRKVIDRFRISW
jgi:hypothetical protein